MAWVRLCDGLRRAGGDRARRAGVLRSVRFVAQLGGRFENLRVTVAGAIGSFEWDFVATGPDGTRTSIAGCDLLAFEGDMVKVTNAFRKQRG